IDARRWTEPAQTRASRARVACSWPDSGTETAHWKGAQSAHDAGPETVLRPRHRLERASPRPHWPAAGTAETASRVAHQSTASPDATAAPLTCRLDSELLLRSGHPNAARKRCP